MTLDASPPGVCRRENTPDRAPDRAARIADILQQNILSGHYQPGDRLPSETDLCAHFAVSRPTLREALGRLVALGLIRSRRGAGGGAFVTRPEPATLAPQIGALLALASAGAGQQAMRLEARLALLAACAQLAAQGGALIDPLRAEIDLQADFKLPDDAFHASRQRLYQLIIEASANPLLTLLGKAVIGAEFATTPTDGFSTRERARFLSFHVRLANAIGAARPEDAAAALSELAAFEHQRLAGDTTEPEPEPERPPRMRDLRPPPVQRLGDRQP